MTLIGADTPDDSGEMQNNVRIGIFKGTLDGALLAQVVILLQRNENLPAPVTKTF